MESAEELISRWEKLNKQADKLLEKHESFIKYNGVRLKMDSIEKILQEEHDIDVWNK
jgi:hypothetical protein